jgi:hypothetical protein
MVMADVGQVLATGGTTIVGVAVGAGLTYWFGALNRRHQEAREDRTRWYEARFKSYVGLFRSVVDAVAAAHSEEEDARNKAVAELSASLQTVRFVGSPEAALSAQSLFQVLLDAIGNDPKPLDDNRLRDAILEFSSAARKDLGHSVPTPSQSEVRPQRAVDASEERP